MPKNSYHAGRNRHMSRSRSPAPKRSFAKQTIHFSQFIKPARTVEVKPYVPTHQFADFAIHDLLKKNIENKGFITPSHIQDQAIPHALAGKDVVGIANTGTGKTAAFAIPVLHQLLLFEGSKALIIAPTRELAQQIEEEIRSLAKSSGLSGALLIGGASMGAQISELRRKPRIVIGTPGRIKDHVQRELLDLSGFNIVVLDEVDRMLDMGFIGDIRMLLSRLDQQRQSLFFSATMDKKIELLIQGFTNDPITISVKTGETSDNVAQDVVRYEVGESKVEKLHDVLIQTGVSKALVFDDTKRSVERLSKELVSRGFAADSLHGGKTQGQRQRALNRFRKNEVNILVATDVAARGIDVVDVTHVINYSVPGSYEDYVHRIGRAGRAGRTGQALTFISA